MASDEKAAEDLDEAHDARMAHVQEVADSAEQAEILRA